MTKADVLKLIKEKCLDCCCFDPNEVKLCTAEDCPLHALRLGKDTTKVPVKTGRTLSPEHKEKIKAGRLAYKNNIKMKENQD